MQAVHAEKKQKAHYCPASNALKLGSIFSDNGSGGPRLLFVQWNGLRLVPRCQRRNWTINWFIGLFVNWSIRSLTGWLVDRHFDLLAERFCFFLCSTLSLNRPVGWKVGLRRRDNDQSQIRDARSVRRCRRCRHSLRQVNNDRKRTGIRTITRKMRHLQNSVSNAKS